MQSHSLLSTETRARTQAPYYLIVFIGAYVSSYTHAGLLISLFIGLYSSHVYELLKEQVLMWRITIYSEFRSSKSGENTSYNIILSYCILPGIEEDIYYISN